MPTTMQMLDMEPRPALVMVDSIQTMRTGDSASSPGSVTQASLVQRSGVGRYPLSCIRVPAMKQFFSVHLFFVVEQFSIGTPGLKLGVQWLGSVLALCWLSRGWGSIFYAITSPSPKPSVFCKMIYYLDHTNLELTVIHSNFKNEYYCPFCRHFFSESKQTAYSRMYAHTGIPNSKARLEVNALNILGQSVTIRGAA